MNKLNTTATTRPTTPATAGPSSTESSAFWLIDEDQREGFKHFLSQFITAHCPACNSRKVFVDGIEHPVTVNDQAQLLAAYYAVCDDCSHVWCRSASPDVVTARCIVETVVPAITKVPTLEYLSREELYELADAANEVTHRMCKHGQTPEEISYQSLKNLWSGSNKLIALLVGPGDTPGIQAQRPMVQDGIANPRPLKTKLPQD